MPVSTNDDAPQQAPAHIDLDGGGFLRTLTPADDSLVFETVNRNRRRLEPWMPWVATTVGPADTRAFIEATIATDGREVAYGIWSGDALAGCMGLHTDPGHRSAMIGYWIDGSHEGRGLVTRAARALTDVAFRRLSLHRVWLSADPRNTRSCAVAERLGFRLEGVYREDTFTAGRYRDTAIYAMLEHEWTG